MPLCFQQIFFVSHHGKNNMAICTGSRDSRLHKCLQSKVQNCIHQMLKAVSPPAQDFSCRESM
uniref:Uncharacterized protein n=1 Tax=Anguilla anguilla TaxID=7936 RepID=A0A0E9Q0L6_ANGAN